MFVERRIGGKGRRAVLGWSPRHLCWKWAVHGRPTSVHRGCEGRKLGKGLEGEGEKFLPGDKGGWTAMVEALRQLDISTDKKEQQEEVKTLGRSRPDMVKGRSFVDTVKGWWNKGFNNIRVEVEREELSRNLSRLEHCLIGSWSLAMQRGRSGKPGLGNGKGLGIERQDGDGNWTWSGGTQDRVVWKKVRQEGSVGEDIGALNFAMGPVGVEKGGRCMRWVFRRRPTDGEHGGLAVG
ncbi:hypothetical protein CK203_105623 [Vitis vinifera]|uniref:Uncharacterized protein n=1 Tax=Vitis vinifera TaxID=29760 RepID=A0A438CUW4_VITVI|nr:hypothetical protein CK203_105623 [Vitis vinifera]